MRGDGRSRPMKTGRDALSPRRTRLMFVDVVGDPVEHPDLLGPLRARVPVVRPRRLAFVVRTVVAVLGQEPGPFAGDAPPTAAVSGQSRHRRLALDRALNVAVLSAGRRGTVQWRATDRLHEADPLHEACPLCAAGPTCAAGRLSAAGPTCAAGRLCAACPRCEAGRLCAACPRCEADPSGRISRKRAACPRCVPLPRPDRAACPRRAVAAAGGPF